MFAWSDMCSVRHIPTLINCRVKAAQATLLRTRDRGVEIPTRVVSLRLLAVSMSTIARHRECLVVAVAGGATLPDLHHHPFSRLYLCLGPRYSFSVIFGVCGFRN